MHFRNAIKIIQILVSYTYNIQSIKNEMDKHRVISRTSIVEYFLIRASQIDINEQIIIYFK